MGDPVKLECTICGETFYLHPADERPVANANLCPTCETSQEGMQGLFYPDLLVPLETKHHDKETLGMLIVSLSAFCVVVFILWVIFQ